MISLSRSDSGTSPLTIRWASPSTMAVLPTPGSPISTGLFLVRRDSTCITRRISSSRPITGSSFPRAGLLGQVAGVALQRLVLVLGRLVGDPVGATDRLECRPQVLARQVGGAQQRLGGGALLLDQGDEQVLGRDVGIAQGLGLLLGPIEDLVELAAIAGLRPPPCWLGNLASSRWVASRSAAMLTPAFWSSGWTIPSSCASSAAKRWASLMTGLPRSPAMVMASRKASWALRVKRSGLIMATPRQWSRARYWVPQELISTRASPTRRVTPDRSAHSSSGIRYLRLRPNWSRTAAGVIPGPTASCLIACTN